MNKKSLMPVKELYHYKPLIKSEHLDPIMKWLNTWVNNPAARKNT